VYASLLTETRDFEAGLKAGHKIYLRSRCLTCLDIGQQCFVHALLIPPNEIYVALLLTVFLASLLTVFLASLLTVFLASLLIPSLHLHLSTNATTTSIFTTSRFSYHRANTYTFTIFKQLLTWSNHGSMFCRFFCLHSLLTGLEGRQGSCRRRGNGYPWTPVPSRFFERPNDIFSRIVFVNRQQGYERQKNPYRQ
jgi:hypothetical protein